MVRSKYSRKKKLSFTPENINGLLKVLKTAVRQRTEPSTRFNETSRGVIPIGEYSVLKRVKMPNYEWVLVNGLWVALIDGFTELKILPDKCENCFKLSNEVSGLTFTNAELQLEIKELEEEITSLEDEIASFIPHTIYKKE